MKDLGEKLEDNERRAFRDKHSEVVGVIGVLAGLGYTFFAKDEKGFNFVNLLGNMGTGAIYGIAGGYILGSLGLMAKSIGEKISEKYYEKYFTKKRAGGGTGDAG